MPNPTSPSVGVFQSHLSVWVGRWVGTGGGNYIRGLYQWRILDFKLIIVGMAIKCF